MPKIASDAAAGADPVAAARPRLQVALDFNALSRARRAAEEAVAGGADLLEVGTPLLKSEGLDAVRELRAAFPAVPIVADTKTMDAGRAEMEMAAKAGASCATVLGVASPSTLRECVEAGRNYGIAVLVDLVGTPDPVAVARLAQELGAAGVGVHCPIDEQMLGRDPFETLRQVRAAVTVTVSVAGGINSETAAIAAAAGADVVIVGGAITKSPDAGAATRAIIAALSEGRARPTTEFRRYGPEQLREALARVSTPNISDAMHRGGALAGLLPVVTGKHMVGRAVTVRTYPGDWAKPVEAIDAAQPGDVLVIDAGGRAPAVWGELATESCLQRKLAGVVIDGAIRDVDAIRALGFPAFARVQCPNAWEPKGFGEIGAPVIVGGVRVAPGDWIVGDDSGVVAVPAERAVEVANRALDVLEMENRVRGEIRAGRTLAEVIELYRWEKAH
ncbi:MAG: bifunctional hexulose-6-phosphate synthase/ribonuclease regulator [Planctomycetes bacterium]|nr:bifunctional hexulose-6-phosphate synthase/ribonuclease regulator [Planctomycetota bacterium]